MKTKVDRLLVSVIWILILLSTLLNNDIWMYIALVLCSASFAFYVFGQGYKVPRKINLSFLGMLCFCLLGLSKNLTGISIRNLISLIAIMLVFNVISIVSNSKYSEEYYIYTCITLEFAIVLQPSADSNTTGGLVVFISMCAMIHVMSKIRCSTTVFLRNYYRALGLVIIGFLAYIVCRERARTALFVGIVIIFLYAILKCIKVKNRKTKREFLFVVLAGAVAIAAYIYITTFEWYSYINSYSVAWFGKNIDSSRPGLWREGLELLEKNLLFGLGTGIQPKDLGILRFDSFHNTFIQLLMQNGIIALGCFLYLLSEVWIALRERIEDDQIKFVMACFMGILIYNCFETTLLSNKLTLGISQWIILAMGYAKVKRMTKE